MTDALDRMVKAAAAQLAEYAEVEEGGLGPDWIFFTDGGPQFNLAAVLGAALTALRRSPEYVLDQILDPAEAALVQAVPEARDGNTSQGVYDAWLASIAAILGEVQQRGTA